MTRWDPTMQAKHGEQAAMRPCEQCGHASYRHRELQGEWGYVGEGDDLDYVEIKPAGYVPGEFHCGDCTCVLVVAA